MKQPIRNLTGRILYRIAPRTADRLLATPAAGEGVTAHRSMRARVEALEAEVQELRHVNRRLADVLDVMTELLVPALDRDDALVKDALARLERLH